MTNARIVTSGLTCLALIYGAGLALLKPLHHTTAAGAPITTAQAATDTTSDLAIPADPAITIHWTEPKVILAGRVPDEASLNQIVSRAQQTYGAGNVDIDIRIVAGKPPSWWPAVVAMFPPDLRVARDASLLVNAGQAFLVGAIARESDRRDLVDGLRTALGSDVALDDQTLAPDAIAQSQRRAALKVKPPAPAASAASMSGALAAPTSAPASQTPAPTTPAIPPAGPTLRQP